MGKIDIFNIIVKMFFINLCVSYIFIRIINYKENNAYKNAIIVVVCMCLAIIYSYFTRYINPIIFSPMLYFCQTIALSYITKNKLGFSVIATTISFVISYVLYIISILISGVLIYAIKVDYNSPLSVVTIPMIESLLILIFFKTKRFKNGFYFLKDSNKIENIGIISFLISGIVLISYGLLHMYISNLVNSCLYVGIVFVAISIVIWLQKQTTKSYKRKMRDRTVEIQKTEIDEKSKMIEEIKEENLKLATAIHKYNHKFEALELAMKNALSLESKTEFAEELAVILKEAEETSNNFANETEVKTNKLPETNIPGIDNMFKYMQEEARKNNINFDLKINESINSLIDNIIPKEKFEILIGDHIKDAIIAVNSSEGSYKSILVTLGLVDGVYEFSIYDTGIEFEIETLLKLGKEQVTTHKETGGSGIGFMTTFETLKECKASLVIEEYNPETTSYTKSVTIRFDGKNKYKICSYRAEKIKEQKYKRRIIIEKLK